MKIKISHNEHGQILPIPCLGMQVLSSCKNVAILLEKEDATLDRISALSTLYAKEQEVKVRAIEDNDTVVLSFTPADLVTIDIAG